jgi:peptidylprolyl isomerase
MVKNGDKVIVHYQGTLKDGTEFDSSEGREPLQFTLGDKMMIPDFEKAILRMKIGETKTFTIPAEKAYGLPSADLVMEVPRDRLPPDMKPEIGDKLHIPDGRGGETVVRVTKVTDSSITIDGNHELAGKDLTFRVKLVGVAK